MCVVVVCGEGKMGQHFDGEVSFASVYSFPLPLLTVLTSALIKKLKLSHFPGLKLRSVYGHHGNQVSQ